MDRGIEFRTMRDGEVLIVENGGPPAVLPRTGRSETAIEHR